MILFASPYPSARRAPAASGPTARPPADPARRPAPSGDAHDALRRRTIARLALLAPPPAMPTGDAAPPPLALTRAHLDAATLEHVADSILADVVAVVLRWVET